MKHAATLLISRLLTRTGQIRMADLLSGIAADIRKGEEKQNAIFIEVMADGEG